MKLLKKQKHYSYLPLQLTQVRIFGLHATKTEYRKRLNAEPDFRLQLSEMKPVT